MKVGWVRNPAVLGLLGAAGSAGLLGWAQMANDSVAHVPPISHSLRLSETPQTDPLFSEKRLRALNADRQKAVISDTEKLVKLARRLEGEVASNPTDELTPQERREVGEIEKLAHDIKARMAQTFGGGPQFQQRPVSFELP